MTSDGKSSHCLWQGELKMESENIKNAGFSTIFRQEAEQFSTQHQQ
jgi:hypothetical protein